MSKYAKSDDKVFQQKLQNISLILSSSVENKEIL